MLWLTGVWKGSFKDTTTRTTRWSLWVVRLAYDEGCQGGRVVVLNPVVSTGSGGGGMPGVVC